MQSHDPRPLPGDEPEHRGELPARHTPEEPPPRPEPSDDKLRDNKK